MDKQQFIEMALDDLYSKSNLPNLPRSEAAAYAEHQVNSYPDGSFAISWGCFKSVWGQWYHVWDPTYGWEVNTGRGVIGKGDTLEEAHKAEQAAYDAAFDARDF